MVSQKNIDELNILKEKLSQAKSVALTDYRGLTVNQATDLRRRVKEAGGELRITKNTLLNLSLKDSNFQFSISNFQLTGPTAVLFAYDDEIAPIKAMADFAKEYELPKFKACFLEGRFLTVEELEELASLPAKDQLQAKLVSCLNSLIFGFVHTLRGNLSKLVTVLEGIRKSKN